MSNKVKLNDKEHKLKNGKGEKYISEDAKEVRNFLIILFSIIIVVLIIYGVSKIFIKDQALETEKTVTEGKIDYDIVSVGTMFNRNYDEYYVAIYDEENPRAVLYSAIITKYINNEDSAKVFFCDLGNKLNINELAFKDLTLVKIENGKIVKYIEDFDTFKEELTV